MFSFFNSGWKSHLLKLTQNRIPKTREENIKELTDKGYDRDFSTELVDFLNNYLPISNFSIDLEDDVLEDYKIDSEDLGDFYSSVLKERNIPIPKRKQQDEFLKGKTAYPVSLVLEFLMWCESQSLK